MVEQRHENMAFPNREQEVRLSEAGERYRRMPVPETIDLYIERGIRQGKIGLRRRARRIFGAWTAAVMIIVFLCGIRISPTFALAVSHIPGMDYIVKLVRFDKGLELAAEHDYFQPVGAYDEHDGVRLTVDGVLADEHRIVIAYRLHSADTTVRVTGIKLIDPATENAIVGSYTFDGEDLQGLIDMILQEGERLADQVRLEMGLSVYPNRADGGRTNAGGGTSVLPERWKNEYPKPDGVWSVTIDLDRELFMGMNQTFDVGETVQVQGQRFVVRRAVIHPLGATVEIGIDPDNSMNIFSFDRLKLVNEKGEEYRNYGAALGESQQSVYFESPYFSMPERLYLEGSRLKALDKDQLEVEIDLESGEIVRAPDDRIVLDGIIERDDRIVLEFRIGLPSDEQQTLYHVFASEFRDSAGNAYESSDGSFARKRSDETFMRNTIEIPKMNYEGNLLFQIRQYPSFIEEPFRIQIK